MKVTVEKKQGIPWMAVLAAIVVIVALYFVMVPSLRAYREEAHQDYLLAEAKTVYLTAENAARRLEIKEQTQVFKGGEDPVSQTVQEMIPGNIQSDYELTIGANGRVIAFKLYDGTYTVANPSGEPVAYDSLSIIS